ncbi:MAG: hypothetical protein WA794_25155, partial [Trebonia sp.]
AASQSPSVPVSPPDAPPRARRSRHAGYPGRPGRRYAVLTAVHSHRAYLRVLAVRYHQGR